MLQELVFSISSVRHNMEDNNDDEEEANEDHRADELFPGCTENSFYLQYCRIFFSKPGKDTNKCVCEVWTL